MTEHHSLIDFVSALDEDTLLVEIKRVRTERERLDTEQRLLEQALSYVRALAGKGPVQLRLDPARGVSSTGGTPDGANAGAATPIPRSSGDSTRGAVLTVLASDRDRTWSAGEVTSALAENGITKPQANVRVMLQRLTKAGVVDRPAQGRYVLKEGPVEEAKEL